MKIDREPLRRRQHEVVYSEGQAGKTVENRILTIFDLGAVITSYGIKQFPLDPSSEYAKKIKTNKNIGPNSEGITKILESTPKGKIREVFVIPQESFSRLAVRPIPGVFPDVTLINLRNDSMFSCMSLFERHTYALLQGLIAECEKEMLEKGVNWKASGFSSRTLVKNALRRIAEKNGTDEEVGKKLADDYKARHESGWGEIEPANDSVTPQASEGDAKTF